MFPAIWSTLTICTVIRQRVLPDYAYKNNIVNYEG